MSCLNELVQFTTRSSAASSLVTFFSIDERFFFPSLHKHPWQLSSPFWVMTDYVMFEWGGTSYNQVLSCKQFSHFFLDRWEVFFIPPKKQPDICQAFFVYYWLIMLCLNKVVQVAARSSAASNFGDVFSTDERSSSLNTKIPTAVKHFWILLTADHVVTECDYTSCSQVFSCKQFDDFFLNRWEVCSSFILPQKVPTAVKHILFYFIDDCWCLIWMSFYK